VYILSQKYSLHRKVTHVYTWNIAYYHDSAACLVKDGEIIEASLRKDGNWYLKGSPMGRNGTRVIVNKRSEFYDYNF